MKRAHYLLRFDDICPTMNWQTWSAVEAVLLKNGVRPLLAVIPDNKDPKLEIDPPDPAFWERCRAWQALGWHIGLHGYQHRYVTTDPGMLKSKPQSEFAGLPAAEQEAKLRAGLDIFIRNGVHADAWIAPSHSFDAATVNALNALGVPVISDGPWRWPHVDDSGMLWVPQQLPRFAKMKPGLWTVCLHHNTWSESTKRRMLADIEQFAPLCIGLAEVVDEFHARRLTAADNIAASWDGLRRDAMEQGAVLWRRMRSRRALPVS